MITDELKNMAGKTVIFARNYYLKTGGTADGNLYYIIKGSLRMYIVNDNMERTVRFAYDDNILVALDSFLTGRPSDLYIQALKKTAVKIIRKEDLLQKLKDPTFREKWILILEQLALQQFEREMDLLKDNPAERYKSVLDRSPQLFQHIPLKYIANYIGVTAETLSRLRKS